MYFHHTHLSYLRLSTERLFLNQVCYKQKAFFLKVIAERMQLSVLLAWLSMDET